MKFILKLLLAPLMLVLWIVEWALTLALKASAVVCVIASALFLLSGFSMSAASAASRQIDTLAVHPIRSMARFFALRCSQTTPKTCAIFCKRNGAAVSSFHRGTSRRISPPCATG